MASECDGDAKGVKGVAVILRTEHQMLTSQNNMVLRFVGIEKAFDTVPREMVLAKGVLKAEARMIKEMQERMKVVLIGHIMLTGFKVNIGLSQISAFNRS